MTPEQHIAALTMPFNNDIVKAYAHRPAPSGLHAKLLRELSERSPYRIEQSWIHGLPNYIAVHVGPGKVLWLGHRDAMPATYRGASDPDNLLTRPASD